MAITYNNSTKIARTNASPVTGTYTCAANTGVLIVAIIVDGAYLRTGGAPTYNGIALTQSSATAQAYTAPETSVELWYLLDPPTGSAYMLNIPNTGSLYLSADISNYLKSVGNKLVFHSAISNSGTSTNPTSDQLAGIESGNLVFGVVGSGYDYFNGYSCSPGKYIVYEYGNGYGWGVQYYIPNMNVSPSLSWMCATSEDWAICVAAFEEVSNLADGVSAVSKAAGYAVLAPPSGPNISKAVVYAVLSTEVTISVSKAVVYAVLAPGDETSGSNKPHTFFIF